MCVLGSRMVSGAQTHVIAALSLGSADQWAQLSSLAVAELSAYVQPPAFGALRVVLPAGQFERGTWLCSAHGDELYVGDGTRGVAVFRDDVLQRHIGAGELEAMGSAVVGDAVFIADYEGECVAAYPRTGGGARLRTFGAEAEMYHLGGLVAYGGRVYVEDGLRLCAFAEEGAFIGSATMPPNELSCGVAAAANQVFVSQEVGLVYVFRADDLTLERRFGGELKIPRGVCVSNGVLFVADEAARRVFALDAASGRLLASLGGFDAVPKGVAVRDDGTLFVADCMCDEEKTFQLYAAQLL